MGQNFPFYYVQIAPHTYQSKGNTPALLREQQARMLDNVSNTGMINISDLVENVKDIHPRNKRAIGERLAYMAMDRHYGQFTQPYESPTLKQAILGKKDITLSFNGNYNGLHSVTKEITGLTISDGDGQMHPAKARITGKNLKISVKGLKAPYQIYYCFDDATIGSLRTEAGLPVLPFRTAVINK